VKPKPVKRKLSPGTAFFRGRSSFNVVEITVLVALLGVLGFVLYQRFAAVREKAYATSVESALRMLTLAEEEFFADHSRYTTDLDSLHVAAAPGVAMRVLDATATGWAAQAAHVRDHRVCVVFNGTAAAVEPATESGVVGCK
jgi:Tfp pilus assembly protein PilE